MIRCGKHHSKKFQSCKSCGLQMLYREAAPEKNLTTKIENKGNKVVTDTRAQGDSKTTQINVISSILSILTAHRCDRGQADLKANC